MDNTQETVVTSGAALTADRLRALFLYEPETGRFIRRVTRSHNARAGAVAGSAHIAGYLCIHIDDHLYLCHRLAWLYVHGRWPSRQLDHINGERSDNKIANLRECSNAENCQNVRSHADASSQHVGVSRSKNKKNPWLAQICINGKQQFIGYFATEEEALAARVAAKKQQHTFEPSQRSA